MNATKWVVGAICLVLVLMVLAVWTLGDATDDEDEHNNMDKDGDI